MRRRGGRREEALKRLREKNLTAGGRETKERKKVFRSCGGASTKKENEGGGATQRSVSPWGKKKSLGGKGERFLKSWQDPRTVQNRICEQGSGEGEKQGGTCKATLEGALRNGKTAYAKTWSENAKSFSGWGRRGGVKRQSSGKKGGE